MSYTIAIAGKGGTGKTTIAALIIRLIKDKKLGSVLGVDADPNNNLSESLGLKVQKTIGDILDEVAAKPQSIPSGMTKDRFIEYQVQTIIQENNGFDLLTMGRPEGPGCYCYVNNILRNIMAKIIKDYDYVVIDNEAGLEHLSRRTTREADSLVVISDGVPVGLKSAKRIVEIVKELDIKIGKNLLIINRERKQIEKEKINKMQLGYIGNIPDDKKITDMSLKNQSVFKLKNNSPALIALNKLLDKIL
jgi:CO dehydrogenase maturation factor